MMTKKTKSTAIDVVVRWDEEDGEVIAILPAMLGEYNANTCLAYRPSEGLLSVQTDLVLGYTRPASDEQAEEVLVALRALLSFAKFNVVGAMTLEHLAIRQAIVNSKAKGRAKRAA